MKKKLINYLMNDGDLNEFEINLFEVILEADDDNFKKLKEIYPDYCKAINILRKNMIEIYKKDEEIKNVIDQMIAEETEGDTNIKEFIYNTDLDTFKFIFKIQNDVLANAYKQYSKIYN